MNNNLHDAIEALGIGSGPPPADAHDLRLLQDRLTSQVLPDWYVDIMCTTRLAGRVLMYRNDDRVRFLEWLDAGGIQSELDAIPGCVAVASGWLPVAACGLGTGDPYFLKCSTSDDPALWQIYHDSTDLVTTCPGKAMRQIAARLSEFLRHCTIVR